MDILQMIKPADLVAYTENFNYKTDFLGSKLFRDEKTDDIKLRYKQLANGANIPTMTPAVAFNAESPIAVRPQFKEIELEKLMFREKIDVDERTAMALYQTKGQDRAINFIFDDARLLLANTLARAEAAKMELLSKGSITVKENNVDLSIDYGFDYANNQITLADWANPDHDILGDIDKIVARANNIGIKVVRAITSSKVLGYFSKNKGIKQSFMDSRVLPTQLNIQAFIANNYGIEFVVNDETVRVFGTQKIVRTFDENTITFLGTKGVIGAGLYGVTPEELLLAAENKVERSLCTLTMWRDLDPAKLWQKVSALFLPMVYDINSMLIVKVK